MVRYGAALRSALIPFAYPSAAAPVQAPSPREMITHLYTYACACGLRPVGAVTPPPRASQTLPLSTTGRAGRGCPRWTTAGGTTRRRAGGLVKESISPD